MRDEKKAITYFEAGRAVVKIPLGLLFVNRLTKTSVCFKEVLWSKLIRDFRLGGRKKGHGLRVTAVQLPMQRNPLLPNVT